MPDHKSIVHVSKGVMLVIAVSLLNVFFALFKDVALAGYLGTSIEGDAFFLAYFFPDMIGNNLISVSLGVAAIPILAAVMAQGNRVWLERSVNLIFRRSAFGTVVLAIFLAVVAEPMVGLIGRGYTDYQFDLTLRLLYIILPTVALYSWVTLSMALLQLHGQYWKSNLVAIIPNAFVLVTTQLMVWNDIEPDRGVYYVSASILAAVICQMLYAKAIVSRLNQFKALKESPMESPSNDLKDEADQLFKAFIKSFASYGFLLLLTQAILYVERYMGSQLAPGSVSAITYAFRLSQFPVLVFSYSIALVAFPEVSKYAGANEREQSFLAYVKSFRQILMLSIPLAIGLSVMSEAVITILFNRKSFDIQSVEACRQVLQGYGLAVVGQGIILLNIRILTALGSLRKPILAMMIVLVMHIVIDVYFVSRFGIAGIGWGAFIASVLGASALTLQVFKRFGHNVVAESNFMVKILYGNLVTLSVAFLLKWIWEVKIETLPNLLQLPFGLVSGLIICLVAYLSMKKLRVL